MKLIRRFARMALAGTAVFGIISQAGSLRTVAQTLPAPRPSSPEHLPAALVTAQDVDEDEDAADAPALPETVVPARPAFPVTPLEGDQVVTPNRGAVAADQVGSSMTVVTGDELRREGHRNAAEALRRVVGLDVVRQGNQGGLTSVFLRGANSQHTKVLLDGMPINDPSSASRAFDFSLLSVDEIERIEVLRGPQSVLYGSDAIGGVINIITRRGDGPTRARVSVEGGSFGTAREAVHVSGGGDRAYFSIGGSYWQTSGFSAADSTNGNRESDGYRNGTISARFGWTPSERFNLDYVIRYIDADTQIDDFSFGLGRPVDNLIRANLTEAMFQRAQVQSLWWEGMLEHVVAFSISDYRRFDTDPGIFVPELFKGQTREVDWHANLQVTETNVLTAGLTYYHEEALSSFQSQVSQNQASAYVQDRFEVLSFWYATVGARWDDHSRAGTAQTYRVTNRIPVDALGGAAHGTIGTGFRAPSLAENLFQFGNPNLRPERSKGWDVGWEQQFADGRLIVDATYFRNDFRDLIVFDFNTFSLQNVGLARSHGVELAAQWRPTADWGFTASYTYDDTEDVSAGRLLFRRPRNKAALGIDRYVACGAGVVRVDVIYVDDRLDTGNNVLDEYFLVNLSGRYAMNDRWSIYGRVDNVLDENYQEVFGYGSAPLSGYAGIEFRQ